MPGIFGGLGCHPAVYDALENAFKDTWGKCEVLKDSQNCLGGHALAGSPVLYTTNDSRAFVADGEGALYRNAEHFVKEGKKPLFDIVDHVLKLTVHCKGNIGVLDKDQSTLYLGAESTGSFPLYYATHGSGFLFSSHLRPLARILGAPRDNVGIIEFMRYGYTIGNRTLFKNIFRVLPGQVITFEGVSGRLNIREGTGMWAEPLYDLGFDEVVDLFWEALKKAVRNCFTADHQTALMMSAGWDSRLLLAGLCEYFGTNLRTYSHGDVNGRELSIVKRMIKDLHLRGHFEQLDESMYDIDELGTAFARTENVIFPHWHRAGYRLAQMGVSAVTAGIFGEIIGGHYSRAAHMGNAERMLYVVSKLRNKKNKRAFESSGNTKNAYHFFRIKDFNRPWYLHDHYWNSVPGIQDEVNADIERHLKRIEERGTTHEEQLIEAYFVEARHAQYIAPQLMSCRTNVHIANIYGDNELLSLSTRIPMAYKFYNRLNRAVLSRYAPDLLGYPTAAILMPAGAPILVQELTRLIRRVGFEMSWKLHFQSRGFIKPIFLGWDNFSFLRGGKRLSLIASDIKNDSIDKEAIQDRIKKLSKNEWREHPYNVSDQFMKIYTVDLMLR